MAPLDRPEAPGIRGARAAVFDAYGTLFDVASAAERAKESLGAKWQQLAELWRAKQLQYTWLRSLMGKHADFWRVTGDALDFAMESLGVDDRDLRQRLMALYERLGAYPDARPALERLRAMGLKLAILSNGAPRMLAAAGRCPWPATRRPAGPRRGAAPPPCRSGAGCSGARPRAPPRSTRSASPPRRGPSSRCRPCRWCRPHSSLRSRAARRRCRGRAPY